MQTEDHTSELLVPPRRLGGLLAEARLSGGYSLDEAADALGNGWTNLQLLEVETGRRPVLDPDLKSLTELYGIRTSSLIPSRSRLVIDLSEGVLAIGDNSVELTSTDAERHDVLNQYLAMVYSMREMPPGTTVPLRTPDMDVLSSALSAPMADIETELQAMMAQPDRSVETRMQRLKGRLLVPVIGVVVAATTAGMLLLVSNDSDASNAGSETGVDASTPPDVEIGDAVVQERLPDGTPGPVEVRD